MNRKACSRDGHIILDDDGKQPELQCPHCKRTGPRREFQDLAWDGDRQKIWITSPKN